MPELPIIPPVVKMGPLPAVEWDRMHKVKENLDLLEDMVAEGESKIFRAQMLLLDVLQPHTPREIKSGIYYKILDSIDGSDPSQDYQVARIALDTIRAYGKDGKDSIIRTHLIAMTAERLQANYLISNKAEIGNTDISRRALLIHYFNKIAGDPTSSPRERAWAKFLLAPPAEFAEFVAMVHDKPWNEVHLPIENRLTEIGPGGQSGSSDEDAELIFTGRVVVLNDRYLPTREKIATYKQEVGKSLPIFVSYALGNQLKSKELPPSYAEPVVAVLEAYRNGGAVKKRDVFAIADQQVQAFIHALPPAQKEEMTQVVLTGKLLVRFASERSARATSAIPAETAVAA